MAWIRRFSLAVLACGLLAHTFARTGRAIPSGRSGQVSLAQAIVAYGFLRSSYPDFDDFLKARASSPMARDLKALEEALDSLHCDLPTRLAFPHRVSALDSLVPGQWVEFEKTSAAVPEQAGLFVVQLRQNGRTGVLVILSSIAPERATVFWLGEEFVAKLVYDSFEKGSIANEPATQMGAVFGVSLQKDGHILLKEWSEPGSRGQLAGHVGRIFEIELARGRVILKNRGALPQP